MHRPPAPGRQTALGADVLVPQVGVGGDEVSHQVLAGGVVEHGDLDAGGGEPVVLAGERAGLADDEARDAELPDQAAAVPARRQRGHHGRAAVAGLPAGGAEGGGLRVHRRVAVLDPPVVPPPQQLAVPAEQRRADRDAALPPTGHGLLQRNVEHSPGIGRLAGRPARHADQITMPRHISSLLPSPQTT